MENEGYTTEGVQVTMGDKKGPALAGEKNCPKYSIEHPVWAGCVAAATYEEPQMQEDGRMKSRLRKLTFGEKSRSGFVGAVLRMAPPLIDCREYGLPEGFKSLTDAGCVVKDRTVTDLSFDYFWNLYDYKVGNKARVKKMWESLDAETRMAAIGGVERQKRHSAEHRTDLPYPQTYINQRRWENCFN